MRLTEYEKKVQREVDKWQRGESSIFQRAFDLAMRPLDWVVDQVIPESLLDQADEAVSRGLELVNDASEWTYTESEILERASKMDININEVKDLQNEELEKLDLLATDYFSENTILAAIQGGGMSLGGPVLVIADIPLLFTLNFRLMQQIGACYGFSMRGSAYRPLMLSIYNVASSGSQEAKKDALREVSVAAAAFAHGMEYKGKRSAGSFEEQSRHLPREIAKNLIGRKLGQMIPLAGIAIGAGVNYWFTSETARTTYMLFRTLFIERKERT